MNEWEVFAAETVARLLGGRAEPRDIADAPPNTHDFDVALTDGRVVALEVTSWANDASNAMWQAVAKREWRLAGLTMHWHLSVTERVDVARLHREAPGLLRKLEDAGFTDVVAADASSDTSPIGRETRAALRALGVRTAHGFPTTEPLVTIGSHGPTWPTTDAVVEAVERVAARPDNCAKLGRAAADERHLWIFITREPASSALSLKHLPDRLPRLPAEVDTVWAAMGGETLTGRKVARLWRVTPPAAWLNLSK